MGISVETVKKHWPWAVRGFVLLIVLFLVYSWNSAHSARAELAKALEAEKLRNANLIVEQEQRAKDLKKSEQQLMANNADLRAERERLWKELGEKPKVVEVIKWKTLPVPSDPGATTRPDPQPGEPPVEVLFAKGDTGHVEVNEVTYETRKGNRVLIGNAACMRDTPTPSILFKSTFEAALTSANAAETPDEPRWGAGALFAFTKDGWAAGPKILFPPAKVWKFRGELDAGVGIGPDGTWAGVIGAGVRW